MKWIYKTTLCCLIPIASLTAVFAQEEEQSLNLFQATDNPEESQRNNNQTQRTANRPSGPAFTLVGTSRFGDEYFASLVSREGESIQVQWGDGIIKEIEGYRGFGVADINGRSVSIRIPASEECIEAIDRGVRCNGNIAVLSLTNASPMASRKPDTTNGIEISEAGGTGDSPSDSFVINGNTGIAGETLEGSNVLARNPFTGEPQTLPNLTPEEQAAREERRQRRAEQFRDFEIVRIADDEVPQGMQRIRTPFGDRLEPVED